MSRRELREHIFKMLFRIEFYDENEFFQQLSTFFEEFEKISQKDKDYIQNKLEGVLSHLQEIDEKLNQVSKGWKTSRMSKVDLTLMRLAVYEMQYEEDIPVGVAINEAVELSKSYGSDESPAFVNGILGKLA